MKPSPGLPIPVFLSPLSDKHLLRTYCAQPLGIQWCFQGLQSLVKPIILPCAAQFKEGLGSHQQVGYRCHEAMGTVSRGEWNASL